MAANGSEPNRSAQLDEYLLSLYMKFELAEGICLSVMSVLTVSANILLLMAIWKDPEKNFRSPTTYFLIGLGITDLLTGATTEPFFAAFYIAHFLHGDQSIPRMVSRLYAAGQSISTVTISSSYLIILFLSVSQYIAMKWPHKFKVLITRNRVIGSVSLSWLYFICFTLVLHFSGIDTILFLKVDLALHPVLISTVLFITLILLYRAFKRQVQQKGPRKSFLDSLKGAGAKAKADNVQRQFTIVTFYLAAILLISALPHIAIQFVWLYADLQPKRGVYYIFMALRIRDLLLFLKVALDAFIYAWRLPVYRQALKKSLYCSNNKTSKKPSEEEGTQL